MPSNRQHLLIVGAGMATAYLLQALSKHDHDLRITVIGEEAQACYNRVMLSGLLAGEATEEELCMLAGQPATNHLTFMSGTRVEELDLLSRSVLTDAGRRLSWDRLVLATGAQVARPDSLGDLELEGVEQLRTLQDVHRLRQRAANPGEAIVIGGGLLGLEAAHGLNELGFQTRVLHRREWLMNRQLDREGGELLIAGLEARGISFHLPDRVVSLQHEDGVLTGVELQSGQSLSCQLLVLAPGITPNKELAESAGLPCDRGVLVDEKMRCAEPGCFALGECSQLGEQCFGLVAPIRSQAEVLARELLGIRGEDFEPEDWPAQLKISGIEIFSAGPVDARGDALVFRDTTRGTYRRLVIRGNRLRSAILVGDKREGTWYRELISSGQDISSFRPQLMFGRETVPPAAGTV